VRGNLNFEKNNIFAPTDAALSRWWGRGSGFAKKKKSLKNQENNLEIH